MIEELPWKGIVAKTVCVTLKQSGFNQTASPGGHHILNVFIL